MQVEAMLELNEDRREYQDNREKQLKRKLIDLLRKNRHAKYAERLEKYDIQIVPIKVDPKFTAAIRPDKPIIYIGEGFLTDPSTFYQLNVLIRHELAHNLLMHQVRMANKLGELVHVRTRLSQSLNTLQNIIADDEISNRKYTEEDKIIVRNMTLNGRLVGGLVTEDHRKGWINLSIEEMHDKIKEELKDIREKLKSGMSLLDIASAMNIEDDPVNREILHTYSIYADTQSDSVIRGSLKAFIDGGCKINKRALKDEFIDIVKQIYDKLNDESMADDEVKRLINEIATSSPAEVIDLFGDGKVELYTPEEKYIAIEVLKKFRSEYALWYDKVISSLGDLTDEELRELLNSLK